jgi:hypothetical protein
VVVCATVEVVEEVVVDVDVVVVDVDVPVGGDCGCSSAAGRVVVVGGVG